MIRWFLSIQQPKKKKKKKPFHQVKQLKIKKIINEKESEKHLYFRQFMLDH